MRRAIRPGGGPAGRGAGGAPAGLVVVVMRRTLSDSPKKPCGRNTSTAMSTTKIQT